MPNPSGSNAVIETNTISIPIYNEQGTAPSPVGLTCFQWFDQDALFLQDAPRFAKFATRRLGFPMMDVELQHTHLYTALEEAINTYSTEVYNQKVSDNYIGMLGLSTGSLEGGVMNSMHIHPNLSYFIELSEQYGQEAGVGGSIDWRSGILEMKANQQVYDLDEWARVSGSLDEGDKIEIKRIIHGATPAISKYINPFYGGDGNLGGMGGGTSVGLDGAYAAGGGSMSYMMMPLYMDILKTQQIELNDQIRRSAFSFEIINNKLRIFPIPIYDFRMRFDYIHKSDRQTGGFMVDGHNGTVTNTRRHGVGFINDFSQIPFTPIIYSQVNLMGKQWIYEYALAICKQMLGYIRGKYSTVPIPGSEVSLNASDLISSADDTKDKLLEQLRTILGGLSRQTQMESKNGQDDAMQNALNRIPMLIYVG